MGANPADLFDVSGKIACVTGCSGGLGQAAATALANAGAKVVGVARRADNLEEWSKDCEGQTAWLASDLAAEDDLEEVAAQICWPFGPPDILINAAGLNPRKHADEVTPQVWDQTLDINLKVPFFLAQAMVPAMAAKGWGRVINFASLQSRRAFLNGLAYGASKGGVEQMTRAMAQAWSSKGVMVNALGPGFFPTELTQAVFDDPTRAAANAAQTCIGRNGTLEDIHGPVLFLCSKASDYVTGQLLFVDGGFTAK